MRRARFLTSAASLVTIAGGALLLSTPRQAEAAMAGCSLRQLSTAEEIMWENCPNGADADIWCSSNGSMVMDIYCW